MFIYFHKSNNWPMLATQYGRNSKSAQAESDLQKAQCVICNFRRP